MCTICVSFCYTLNELFHGEFNIGYPPEAADRKRQEVQLFLELNKLTKKSFLDIIDVLDSRLLSKVLERKNFTDYLFKYGNNQALLTRLHTFKN